MLSQLHCGQLPQGHLSTTPLMGALLLYLLLSTLVHLHLRTVLLSKQKRSRVDTLKVHK